MGSTADKAVTTHGISDDDIEKLDIKKLREKVKSKGIEKGSKEWDDLTIHRRRQLKSRKYSKKNKEGKEKELEELEENVLRLETSINELPTLEALESKYNYYKQLCNELCCNFHPSAYYYTPDDTV